MKNRIFRVKAISFSLMVSTIIFLNIQSNGQNEVTFLPQIGPTGTMYQIVFSDDNSSLTTLGLGPGEVIVWDKNSGREINSIRNLSCNNATISDDGKYFVGYNKQQLIVYDITASKMLYSIDLKSNIFNDGTIYAGMQTDLGNVVISGDNKLFATASSGNYIAVYELLTGKRLWIKKDFTDELVSEISFISHTYDLILGTYDNSSSKNAELCIIDAISSVIKEKTKNHPKTVRRIICSKSGKLFATTINNYIYIWDKENLKNYQTITVPTKSSICEFTVFAFSNDDNEIIACAQSDMIYRISLAPPFSVKKVYTINSKSSYPYVTAIAYSSDDKEILYGTQWMDFVLIDKENGNLSAIFQKNAAKYDDCAISQKGNLIAVAPQTSNIKLIDKKTGLISKQLSANGLYVNFGGNDNYIITSSDSISIWEINKNKKIYSSKLAFYGLFDVSPDGKNLAFVAPNGFFEYTLKVVQVTTGTVIDESKIELNRQENPEVRDAILCKIKFLPDNKRLLAYYEYYSSYFIRDIVTHQKQCTTTIIDKHSSTGTMPHFFMKGINVKDIAISSDGEFFMVQPIWNFDSIRIVKTNTGEIIKNVENNFASCIDVVLKDMKLRTFVGNRLGFTNEMYIKNAYYLLFKPDQIIKNDFIVSLENDGFVQIKKIKDNSWIKFITNDKGSEWLIFTNDGYWDSSPSGGYLVSMKKQNNIYNIDQFAVYNNRPDIILERLGNTDKSYISYLNHLFKRRLIKSGILNESANTSIDPPFSRIVNSTIKGSTICLEVELKDSNHPIESYNIFVNNVPIFGTLGKPLPQNQTSVNECFQLQNGVNKIEVSATNSQKIESYRNSLYVENKQFSKPDLYLISIGVSKYKNPSYNLQYADKDALDLSKVIESLKGKGFENVYTKVITNEQVTPESIRTAKDFVKNAKPDDVFILFIAGHGIHDTNPDATYYYLTYNADLKNLKGTAADFETIEELLQGIPPRNKLFLMDACESGEIDDISQGKMVTIATGIGINTRGFKKINTPTVSNTTTVNNKRSYLFQKDRFIYNDLSRRSGAIVFSSSKGGELSYERSDIQNGLFTYWVMKALTTKDADKNNDGVVSTDELRDYVGVQVAKASGDLQHPTVDRDNIYQKFGFTIK